MPNKYSYYIGIDPGLTGAICVLDAIGEIMVLKNHKTITNQFGNFIDFKDAQKIAGHIYWHYGLYELPSITAIEKQFILGNQKGNDIIWRNYERLMLAYLPNIEIRPQKWKKTLEIPKGLNKKESIQYQLQHICPKDYDWYKTTKTGKKSIQLDDGKIDAYCIAKHLYIQNKV